MHQVMMEPLHRVFRYQRHLEAVQNDEIDQELAKEAPINVPTEAAHTAEDFRRQLLRACSAMRNRLLVREEMFEKRWAVEHKKLAEALSDIIKKSKTIAEFRARCDALRKCVIVAERERS